jgi:hypothetical protein
VVIGEVEVDAGAGLAYIEAVIRESGSVVEGGEVVKRFDNSITVEYMLSRAADGSWRFSRARTVPMLLA